MWARHHWFNEDLQRLFGLLATGAGRSHVAAVSNTTANTATA
jgi:hypothetical protein